MICPLYSGLAITTFLTRLVFGVYELESYSEPELKSMLCPGVIPSFKSSSETSPSNALTICDHLVASEAMQLTMDRGRSDLTWLILGRLLAEWRMLAAAAATMRAISAGS